MARTSLNFWPPGLSASGSGSGQLHTKSYLFGSLMGESQDESFQSPKEALHKKHTRPANGLQLILTYYECIFTREGSPTPYHLSIFDEDIYYIMIRQYVLMH